jgi:hypothetical protein
MSLFSSSVGIEFQNASSNKPSVADALKVRLHYHWPTGHGFSL